MQGNNIESKRFRIINIPLNEGSVTGRYYLPEDPILEKYTIVGIQAHFNNSDISVGTNNFILGQPTYNLPRFPILLVFPAQRLTLNLYNQNDEEIISNFPLSQLAAYNLTPKQKTKINAFNFKIKTRKSFITCIGTNGSIGIPNVSLTFFLK
jgi:hypothetical protein